MQRKETSNLHQHLASPDLASDINIEILHETPSKSVVILDLQQNALAFQWLTALIKGRKFPFPLSFGG